MTRHFLKLSDLSADELSLILRRAIDLKRNRRVPMQTRPFAGKTLAMIFAKNSTRTRVSFEAGMAKMGGHALFLPADATQIGRNEPLSDTARVISRMVDAIMIRNDSQADQEELAAHSDVPVINGLSDLHHPCQILADLQTWMEHRGPVKGRVAAWIGDGNNVCHSWIEAARLGGFKLRIACPSGYGPEPPAAGGGRRRGRCGRRADLRRQRGGCRRHRHLDQHGPGKTRKATAWRASPTTRSTKN